LGLCSTFRSVKTPVLLLEEDLLDDMQMTGAKADRDFGDEDKQTQINILNWSLSNGLDETACRDGPG
jgi:hypothetical protein